MLSGYLTYKRVKPNSENQEKTINKSLKSNAILLLSGFLLTFIMYLFRHMFLNKPIHLDFIITIFKATYLWFTYSLMFALFLYKKCKKDKHINTILTISGSLIFLMYIIEFILGHIFLIRYNNYGTNLLTDLLFGTFYVFLGIYISKNEDSLMLVYKNKVSMLLFISCIFLSVLSSIEYLYLGKFYTYGLSQIPFVFVFFLFVLTLKQINISDKLSKTLRKSSIYLYIVHPPLLVTIGMFRQYYNLSALTYTVLCFLVMLIAVVLVYSTIEFKNKRKFIGNIINQNK